MNNKSREINNLLKDLYYSVCSYNTFLTSGAVYNYLLGKDVNNIIMIDGKGSNFFNNWINRFKYRKNINVFVDEKWSCFCQFTNDNSNYTDDIIKLIKMYIPLDYNHIEEGANRIFDFLEKNNIKHHSKILSYIRSDNIVIRLYSKEDAMRLQKFVSKNKYIKEGMLKVNPFCFSKDGVGYAYDNMSSYNSYVSSLVSDYINIMKMNNANINDINKDSFYDYVNRVGLDINKMNSLLGKKRDNMVNLSDAYVMNELLKISLKSNDIREYNKFYDIVSNRENRNNIESNVYNMYHNSFVANNQQNFNNSYGNVDKEELLKEFILVMMKKYPLGYDKDNPNRSGWDYIISYLKGCDGSITRKNNLRKRVSNNLSKDDIYNIIDNSGIVGNNMANKVNNYIKMVMLDDIIKSMYEKYPNYYINNIGIFVAENDIKYITNTNGARDLAKTFQADDIRRFLNDIKVYNIYNYINNYFIKNSNDRRKK